MLISLYVIGVACCLIAAHPFTTYPLSLWLLSRLRKRRLTAITHRSDPSAYSVAICMSAYNEEAVIAARVESLLASAATHGNAVIHVYADAPSDRTVEILRRYEGRINLLVSAERTGKTYGMNQLVAQSRADILVFTDANVTHDNGVLAKLLAPFTDPTIGCTSAHLAYINAQDSPTAAAGAVYWKNEERIKRLESEGLGLIGIDGALFAMRRDLYRAPPVELIDDLYLSLIVVLAGRRAISVPDALVFERSAVFAQEEKLRKRRIACQGINIHRELWPELRSLKPSLLYCYISHRLIKWMTPFLAALAATVFFIAVSIDFGLLYVISVTIVILFLLMLSHRFRIFPLSLIATAILSLYGVGAGVIDAAFRKSTYTIWKPAESVRD